jgi:N-acetylneuraminic acid mutarotase
MLTLVMITAASALFGAQPAQDGEAMATQGPAVASGFSLGTPWRPGPSLPEARAGLAATSLDGRIFAAGGAGLVDPHDNFEEYDPDIGRWLDRVALPVGLERFAMASLGGRIYVAGGFSAESGSEPIASVWSFDPQANVWQGEPDMPGAKSAFSLLSVGDKLYAVGGGGGVPGVFVYDAHTLEWSALPAPLHINRRGAAAVVVDETIWLIGGVREGQSTGRVDIFDVNRGEWRDGPPLPEPRAGHAAAVLNGHVHVFGGRSADMQRTVRDHFTIALSGTRWTTGPALPSARTEAAAASLDGEVWLIGGGAGSGFFAPFTAVDTVDVIRPTGDG